MAYVQGFVAAVPTANRAAYEAHARQTVDLFREFGTRRFVEAWGDDVPRGKRNDFQGAVQARDDESVVFSWMEYPDRAARDAAFEKMMADPRMQSMPEMPFDGTRMILGGFQPFVEQGAGRGAYYDGYLLAVPQSARYAYRGLAEQAAAVFLEHGAVRVVEAWGDDVPEGKRTDFRRAVLLEDGEQVVFSWVEWPSRRVRDEAMPELMADPRMQPGEAMPFDGSRVVSGGFVAMVDE